MKNKQEWETRSLEWIHKVRAQIHTEISKKGLTLSQWIKKRGKIDAEKLCRKLGLNNCKIVSR